MQRFGENKELLKDVREGMSDNLRLAKSNIDFLKNGGRAPVEPAPPKPAPVVAEAAAAADQEEEDESIRAFPGLPPEGAPPQMAKKEE